MRYFGWLLSITGTAGLAAVSVGVAQAPAAPKARYWMDAETTSGLGAGMNPMAMMTGRGGGAQHALHLRLGSTLAPTGAPKADHFMPAAARLGASVPLVTPVAQRDLGAPGVFERPKGRLRIYWGCGPKAGPGQPIVFDFAKLAAGQFPPNLFTTSVPLESGPTSGNSRTFGSWPNAEKTRALSADSSLIGAHRVAGTYSPEINFNLGRDFMPPLRARGTDAAGGAIALSWEPLTDATGYYATAMGAATGGGDAVDAVWWTSAGSQHFGGGLAGWLSPATVARLIGQNIVLPPSQTNCTIPAEVKAAAGEALATFLTAYGPEADFAFPPRPDSPRAVWRPEWTAKVRFRASTMIIPGLDMEAAMRGDEPSPGDAPKKKCKKRGGLGGMLGGALGSALGAKDC